MKTKLVGNFASVN